MEKKNQNQNQSKNSVSNQKPNGASNKKGGAQTPEIQNNYESRLNPTSGTNCR